MGLFTAFEKISHQDWINKIEADLKGKDFNETLVWNTKEGIAVQPFYNSTPENITSTPLKKNNAWKIREIVIVDSPEKANKKALLALQGGANSIQFIGKIKDQLEMNELLKDIQTDIIEINFYNSEPADTVNLIDLKEGNISFDYLGEFFKKGDWHTNKENDIEALALSTSNGAQFKSVSVKGNNFNQHTIIEEIAFTLSQGLEYLNLLTDKDISPSIIASRIEFTFGVGTNYFFEIAKLRVARKLWSLILNEYDVVNEVMTIHSETSVIENSEEDNNYNILRNTSRSMSAIIGGCDSLSILPHDNSEDKIDFSNRIARNIHHILKEESFFEKVNNPADGAYYIEQLTDELSEKSWNLFKEIEANGGFLEAISTKTISVC